jgi:hypothetical protein
MAAMAIWKYLWSANWWTPRPPTSRCVLSVSPSCIYRQFTNRYGSTNTCRALFFHAEMYREYPRPPSLECSARNMLTVLRETLTQHITCIRGGREESVFLYVVVLQPWCPASTPLWSG